MTMMRAGILYILCVVLIIEAKPPNKSLCREPPHSDECLIKKWILMGCRINGLAAPPDGTKTEIWRNMQIKEAKDDMKKYRKRAMRGLTATSGAENGTEYMELCYGKSGDDCGEDPNESPHTLACLRDLWSTTGCPITGTLAPYTQKAVRQMNQMKLHEVNSTYAGLKSLVQTNDPTAKMDCYGCGISNKDAFIVGGTNVTDPLRWPWMVIVQTSKINYCNGVILGDKWILTSTSCAQQLVSSLKYDDVMVRPGHPVYDYFDTPTVIVANIYNNSREVADRLENDVALLELKTMLNLGPTTRPICLPDPSQPAVFADCYIAGWGGTEEGEWQSDVLHEARVNIMTDADCASQTSKPWIPSGGVICARAINGGQTCKNDRGSALMCKQGGSGHYVVAGVQSFNTNEKCTAEYQPMGFGEITENIAWIRATCNNCI